VILSGKDIMSFKQLTIHASTKNCEFINGFFMNL